jgi:Domain of unknown function (DUF2341)/SprB repeat
MQKGLLHKNLSIAIFLILGLGIASQSKAFTGPGAAWLYLRKITLNAATPLANFQVKVTLSNGQYGNISTNGNDLRFYDANNNSCSYCIELWNTSGNSVIWVNIPVSGANALYMFYGNPSAPPVSDGAATFNFFEDFPGTAFAGNWTRITNNGTATVTGGNAVISNTNGGNNTGGAGIYSSFTPQSPSFIIEAKHNDPGINRNRYYALDASNPSGNGGSDAVIGVDYGFFLNNSLTQVFWGNNTNIAVSANTDYLTRWDITDGTNTPYKWSNYLYSSGAQVSSNTINLTKTIRYVCFRVTEQTGTSMKVDWVRVRKAGATEPSGTAGPQLSNISSSISAQNNANCFGKATGSITVSVSGGATPYTYSWNTSPVQNTAIAGNLPAGTYNVTVTDANGLTTTASASITQPVAVLAAATSNNLNCFNSNDGSIQVTGSSGFAPYQYSVDNGNNYQTSDTFNNLSAGSYKIRVKDNNGCESKPIQ